MEQVLRENGCEVISVNMEWDAMSYAYNKNIILKYWDIIRDTDGCMTNDIGALSCLAVARKMGLAISEQFKIIGYDGTELPISPIPNSPLWNRIVPHWQRNVWMPYFS